jgi:signal transduction histidine kinase
MSIIDGKPYSATAVPQVGSVLLLITKAGMRRICYEYESLYGKILERMVKQMSSRLRQSTEVMANALLEKDRLYLQVENLEAIKSQLVAATESKSQFLANMSHELRTPLNAILGYTEILKEDLADDDVDAVRFTADLDNIHGSGSYLLALINDILDLSKIEAGRMDLHIEYFDVRAMVDEVLDSVAPLSAKNGNRITRHYAGEMSFMRSDRIKLRQILLNLLGNACNFTHKGEITVNVSQEVVGSKRCYQLSVKDSGVGMTEEQMTKLFQPFEQTSAAISKQYGGTGLGLMVSQKLANLLGGEIVVTSTLGAGAVFTLKVFVETVEEEENFPLCL